MKAKYKLKGGRILAEADAMARGDSFDAMRSRVAQAINTQIRKGIDMDLDDDGDADINDWAYIEDMYPSTAIYCMSGRLFAIDYSINKSDVVTLGTPVAVEISYTPVKESRRTPVAASFQFRESSYNASTGKLTMTIIKPGFNTSKSRYYKESTLKRDHKIFEGAKMFVNHATKAEENSRPEGDVNQWVAQVGKTWTESDGTVMGEAAVIDPVFRAKLDRLAETKLLGEMGVSIRAIGESYQGEVEGVNTAVVESFIAARSVDFVTYPGAGGRIETIEADAARADAHDLELVTETQLRSRRPDLVLLVESKVIKETEMQKTVEQLEKELRESAEANTKLTAELKEKDNAILKANAKVAIGALLTESKLPAKAQERLAKQFAEALNADGVKEAIEAEREYIKALGGTATPAAGSGVRNMGTASSVNEGATDGTEKKVNLVESFKLMGLSEEEAKIAAKGK